MTSNVLIGKMRKLGARCAYPVKIGERSIVGMDRQDCRYCGKLVRYSKPGDIIVTFLLFPHDAHSVCAQIAQEIRWRARYYAVLEKRVADGDPVPSGLSRNYWANAWAHS